MTKQKCSPSFFLQYVIVALLIVGVTSFTNMLVAQEEGDPSSTGETIATPEVVSPPPDADIPPVEETVKEDAIPPDRPLHIRKEEREQLKEENQRIEQLGREIESLREAAADRGEDVPFEVLKAQAEAKLFQAAGSFGPPPFGGLDSQAGGGGHFADGVPGMQPQRVCFRTDGSVTSVREECDPDQGRHFGVPPPDSPQGSGSPFPSDDKVTEYLSQQFVATAPPQQGGGNLLSIVSEALQRLSGVVPKMEGNPEGLKKVQETIGWLGGILQQYAGGMSAEEEKRLAGEIAERLMPIAGVIGGGGPGSPGGPGGGPDMKDVPMMMEKMMGKLPKVIAIFEEGGVSVPPEAKQASEKAIALFAEIKGPCMAGDMNACSRLREVPEILEREMRPLMEQAVMASGKFEVGMKAKALMEEGIEEGFGPRAGPVQPQMAPGTQPGVMSPQGMPPQNFGPMQPQMAPGTQSGMPPQNFGPGQQQMAPGTQQYFSPMQPQMAPGTQPGMMVQPGMQPQTFSPGQQQVAPGTWDTTQPGMWPGVPPQNFGPGQQQMGPDIQPGMMPPQGMPSGNYGPYPQFGPPSGSPGMPPSDFPGPPPDSNSPSGGLQVPSGEGGPPSSGGGEGTTTP